MKSSSADTSTSSPKELQIVTVLPGTYSIIRITKLKHKDDIKITLQTKNKTSSKYSSFADSDNTRIWEHALAYMHRLFMDGSN